MLEFALLQLHKGSWDNACLTWADLTSMMPVKGEAIDVKLNVKINLWRGGIQIGNQNRYGNIVANKECRVRLAMPMVIIQPAVESS